MTSNFIKILFLLLFSSKIHCQVPEIPNKNLVKNYSQFSHKFEPKSCWKYKYKLKNGLIIQQENYCRLKLMSRTRFEYDKHDNLIRTINTFSVDKGKISDSTDIKLKYKNAILIEKKYDFDLIEKYSDFNIFNKPKLIERKDEFKFHPHKEILEYDTKGNTSKSISFSFDRDLKTGEETLQKEITIYKYDNQNNITEIHRQFEPKQEFPIIIIGGFQLDEIEYYSYKYNKKGLWIKKYRKFKGDSIPTLIAKRNFK